jgi:hypothetical protein
MKKSRQKLKETPVKPAYPANILQARPNDLPGQDKSGPRRSRIKEPPSDNAKELATELNDFISLPDKYRNSLLQVVCKISISPSEEGRNPGYTRLTQKLWDELFPAAKANEVKEKLCESLIDNERAYAYRLKPEVVERVSRFQRKNQILSLEALRAVPNESGVPGLDPLVPVNLDAIALGLDVVNSYLELDLEVVDTNQVNPILREQLLAWKPSVRRGKLETIQIALDVLGREAKERDGFISQSYKYSKPQSRYYGLDSHHVQRVPRLARTIIFHGCTDIDIQCCHHAILLHLAEDKGLSLPALNAYVSNRSEIREQIQRELDAPKDDVKEALIGTINGMGWKKLEALIPGCRDNETFSALRLDIRKATDSLGLEWNRASAYFNTYEKKAVKAALQVHPSAIVCMHDGWITTEDEDIQVAEEAIIEAIDWPLKLEKELLNLEGFPEWNPIGMGPVAI